MFVCKQLSLKFWSKYHLGRIEDFQYTTSGLLQSSLCHFRPQSNQWPQKDSKYCEDDTLPGYISLANNI